MKGKISFKKKIVDAVDSNDRKDDLEEIAE